MRIILSPAKKMREDFDSLPWQDLPRFLPQAQGLLDRLRAMTGEELKRLWRCSDQIAAQNVERLERMDLRRFLTPALLAYEGIQYRYMAPGVFSRLEWAYAQEHLRILSGFYGLLRPLDGVTPYRLEMGAKLMSIDRSQPKPYSAAVSRYLPSTVWFVTCVFGEEQGGRVVEKGTMCKMARGEMARFLAERQAEDPEQARDFDRLGYRFDPARSDGAALVFLRRADPAG